MRTENHNKSGGISVEIMQEGKSPQNQCCGNEENTWTKVERRTDGKVRFGLEPPNDIIGQKSRLAKKVTNE
jgi:hypothetical protein